MATLKTLAPTVASAFLGPLGGIAVSAVGAALGIDAPTQEKIEKAFTAGQMSPEGLEKIRSLELEYQNEEKERGFKYAELEFKDRDSARKANVDGGTQRHLFWLSLVLLVATLGTEIWVLFNGYPQTVPDIIVGRVLGLMDAVAMMVLAYWYGTSNGSALKSSLLAAAPAPK